MTPLQNHVLNYIKIYIDDVGYSPTYKEIYLGCNLASIPQAYTIVKRLIALGYLFKSSKKETRNISVA